VVCGSKVDDALYFCRDHWYKMPLELRRRWQDETELSTKKPSAKLVAEVRRIVNE